MDNELNAMGIASGNNGPDYDFTNLGRNTSMENDQENFMDVTARVGEEDIQAGNDLGIGWGTTMLGADNDTDLDLFVGKDSVAALHFNRASVQDPDRLFLKIAFPEGEKMKFTGAKAAADLSDEHMAPEMAHTNFVKNSDQGLVLPKANEMTDLNIVFKTFFHENKLEPDNNWLPVKMERTNSNDDDSGTQMQAVMEDRSWTDEVVSADGHASHKTNIVPLELGSAGQVDGPMIGWPVGGQQLLTDDAPKHFMQMEEDTAMPSVLDKNEIVATVVPNPCKEQTTIYFSNQKRVELTLELIRLDGTVLNTWTTDGEQLGIDTSALPLGLYVLKIIAENKLINTLKLKVFQ